MIAHVFITILLSVFATVVMSYIALAASIGPWIETTLVLCSMALFYTVARTKSAHAYQQSVGLATAAGGIGGILATGLAFSFPTLYFLSPELFMQWMNNPLFFATTVSFFCLSAGSFGLIMATVFEDKLLIQQKMKFPIGELVYAALSAQGQLKKALELAIGFASTVFLLIYYATSNFYTATVIVCNRFAWSFFTFPSIVLPLEQVPMYLAVGFVTGHVIAIPLLVGFLSKILCLDPLFYIYTHADTALHSLFFSGWANTHLSNTEFTLAFCSGMVLYGSIMGFLDPIKTIGGILNTVKNKWSSQHTGSIPAWLYMGAVLSISSIFLYTYSFSILQYCIIISLVVLCIYISMVLAAGVGVVSLWGFIPVVRIVALNQLGKHLIEKIGFLLTKHDTFGKEIRLQAFCSLLITTSFLWYFKFTWLQQGYLLVGTAICIYQMLIIAGRMGIIPLGRFATFVMVPGMLLFNFDLVQVTLVAAFVEIAGGVAGDVLFGRKLALLTPINHRTMVRYQWLGLIISSVAIGIIFWLFIHNLGLGQETGLPATKAASRALLINFKSFDWVVLCLGFLFGWCLKYIKINPALLLGGILMPPAISLMLITGSSLTYFTNRKEDYFPFFSGVSAGNSLWMLADIFIALFK